jgi:hypothetical protein
MDTTTRLLCLLCHHGLPEPGTYVCAVCTDRLHRDLSRLIGARCYLPLFTEPGSVAPTAGGGSPKNPEAPAPVRLDVVAALDPRSTLTGVSSHVYPIDGMIHTWMRLIVEERPGTTAPGDTVEVLVWQLRHLGWIVAQPWVDEYTAEMRAALYCARALIGDRPDRALGRCPAVDPDGVRDACGGPLRWIDTSRLLIRCARCGDTWGKDDLTAFVRAVGVWLSVADAAHLAGITARTVNRYAEQGKVRRRRGRVLYCDLLAALDG